MADLLDRPVVRGVLTAEVTDLADDSTAVTPGALFVALKGLQHDGHRYVEDAFHRGAVGAVIQEPALLDAMPDAPCLICVADSHLALRQLAASFFGLPSRRLRMIAVTGTNGKTTTSYLVQAILSAAGEATGVIGTIGYRVGRQQLAASHTTPALLALQRLLARMVEERLTAVVMEVSSHALAQARVEGCLFDGAVFTNLTQDHLDYHESMEDYFAAKASLFAGLATGRYGKPGAWAVVNRDDPWGRRLIEETVPAALTYGLEPGAGVTMTEITVDWTGIRGTVDGNRGRFPIASPLVGRFNVPNLLAAVGVGLMLGYGPEVIQRGIREAGQVPGRFEKIDEGQPFGVVVDYAHTEDALRRLLQAVRELQRGRLIVVFGCGGDRDRGKRPKMGRAAAELADLAVITSDNPRSEAPGAILREIEAGVTGTGAPDERGRRLQGHWLVEDRRAAMTRAIEMAQPGDVVVIAGKGHEDYQIIGATRHPFDDRLIAREILQQRMNVA